MPQPRRISKQAAHSHRRNLGVWSRGSLLASSGLWALFLSSAGCAVAVDSEQDLPPRESFPGGAVESVAQALETTHGSRPLLVILMAKSGNDPLARDRDFYRERFFGPSYPNVADYFSATSKNRFTFREAATVSIVDSRNPWLLALAQAADDNSTDSTRLRSLMLADLAGFRFQDYDANADGRVTTDELAVITVDNYSEGLAQTDGTPCVAHPSGVQVCTQVSLVGHKSQLMNYAHELSHQLDTRDLYGSGCNSSSLTLMSCTADYGSEGNWTYYLDPWHRQKLGWSASSWYGFASGSVKLSPVSDITGPFGSPGREMIVLPRSGTREELLIEYRKPDGEYEEHVANDGITFWWVNTDSSGNPFDVPALGDGLDGSVFTLAPSDCRMDPQDPESRGRRGVAQPGSSYRARWYDGTDAGWLFEIGETASDGTIEVSWRRTSAAASCPQVPQPDLTVSYIDLNCAGGRPEVVVGVENRGDAPGRGWVDLFIGLSSPPSIGTLSSLYEFSPTIEPGQEVEVFFSIDHQEDRQWLDILLDTTETLAESNEDNNHAEQFVVAFPRCR